MQQGNVKFIDLEKVIAGKNPRLLKWIPRFILNYIKKVIHEDDLNDAINRNNDKFGYDFAAATLKEFDPQLIVSGIENIPLEGGCIIASNHPLGGLDGIAFMVTVGGVRKDIRFLVNDLLLNLKNYGEIFVPVNKHGKNSKDNIRLYEEIYSSDVCVLIFPAGLVSRRNKSGIIMDLDWKKSFINKSIKYQKPVIPLYIGGNNSSFFYNLAYYRKKLGIKANIEMFYLVDEMYKQKGKTIEFIFGKPISPASFTNDFSEHHWAQEVKKHVYALGGRGALIFN